MLSVFLVNHGSYSLYSNLIKNVQGFFHFRVISKKRPDIDSAYKRLMSKYFQFDK
jgi:hypothetical protein